MMEYLMLFLNWLKSTLAKEALFALFCIPMAVVFSWITEKFLKIAESVEKLENLEIDEVRYWFYLFITFVVVIYGIRLVETIIKTVLVKKEKKE